MISERFSAPVAAIENGRGLPQAGAVAVPDRAGVAVDREHHRRGSEKRSMTTKGNAGRVVEALHDGE